MKGQMTQSARYCIKMDMRSFYHSKRLNRQMLVKCIMRLPRERRAPIVRALNFMKRLEREFPSPRTEKSLEQYKLRVLEKIKNGFHS